MNTNRVHHERTTQPSWVRLTAFLLAVLAAGACLVLAWVAATWARDAWSADFSAPLTRVSAALAAVAAVAGLRLALSCIAALPHLWPAADDAARVERPTPMSSESAQQGSRMPLGAKTAAVLLSIIASIGSASTASASTGTPVVVSASVEADRPVAPLPNFSSTTDTERREVKSDEPVTVIDAPSSTCETPKPGWTPATAVFDESACLVTGVTGTGVVREHTVVRGETLWSIASAGLPQTASPSEVAERVQAWLRANPAIQANPDLLRAGDQLLIPSTAPSHH